MSDTDKYEYDEHGNLLCFGFKPSFDTGKMVKTTLTVEGVCGDANSHYGFGDEEYVYSTRKRRDEEWDERYSEWFYDNKLDIEKYPPSKELMNYD
jgi:hypothetical protein